MQKVLKLRYIRKKIFRKFKGKGNLHLKASKKICNYNILQK